MNKFDNENYRLCKLETYEYYGQPVTWSILAYINSDEFNQYPYVKDIFYRKHYGEQQLEWKIVDVYDEHLTKEYMDQNKSIYHKDGPYTYIFR